MTFDQIANEVVAWAGSVTAVAVAVVAVMIWAALGPYFEWSDSHSLFINTITTIVTFWLAFLILHAQNKSEAAIQVKLDALIKVSQASNDLIRLEQREEEEIRRAREQL